MKTNKILSVLLVMLVASSAQGAQWKLKASGPGLGFGSSTWESMTDSSVTTTTLTADDECFVLDKTINGGHSENATFKGKSLTIGSIKDNIKGYFDQYYNAKVWGGKDNVVENDGLILERGSWCTSYGNADESTWYPLYGKVTVRATVSEPFSIYRNTTTSSALKLMGEVKGDGWLAVKGYMAPEYTLMFLGDYSNFSGGVMLLADSDQSVDSISRLRLPSGTCTATVTAQAGCQLETYSVDAQVSLGKILLYNNAVLKFQATGTGNTADSRVLNCSKFTTTTQFNASGMVMVEVAYTDSASGKFSDAFDLLTVPAGSTLDPDSFVFVPTDAIHQDAEFSVRDDGTTKTLVLTYVGTGKTLLTQADAGANSKGLEGVKWSDGSTGTSSDNNYACVGKEIYISSSNDDLNKFQGNSLRIGDATSGTAGTLREYGGYGALKTHAIMKFPNDGLILACGALASRYSTHYLLDGKIKVTSPSTKPFRMYHDYTKDAADTTLGNCQLTLLGPLSGSGSLQIDSGMINSAWSTNYLVNVFGGAADFTGTISLISKGSNQPGCFGRSGLGLTNGVFGGSINVGTNSYVVLPGLDETVQVKGLTLNNNSELRISAEAGSDGSSSCARVGNIVVTNSFTQNGKVSLNVTLAMVGSVGGDYTLLTVPAASELDKDQFELNVVGDEFYTKDAQLKVTETATTKSLVLSIPQSALVTLNREANDTRNDQIVNDSNKDSFTSCMTNALAWSDGRAVHGDAHYLCQALIPGKVLRTPSNEVGQEGTFPGLSLTLQSVGSNQMDFIPIYKDYNLPLLRLVGKTGIRPCTTGVTIHGNVEAASGTSSWQVFAGHCFKIDGQVSGAGAIVVNGVGHGSSNPGGDVEFAGDNSNYSGRLRVYTTSSKAGDVPSMLTDQYGRRFYERLLASSANNLGGAMSPADPQGVIIEGYTMFIPTATMTIEVPSRGWQIVSNGRFNVTNSAVTLTFKSPLALYGTLWKEGAGRLELGNEKVTFGANADEATPNAETLALNTFVVNQGSVKVLTTNCLNGVTIDVRNGTEPAFVMSTDAEGDLKAVGLCNTLTETPFSVTGEGQKVIFALEGDTEPEYDTTFALCTVKSEAADTVEGLLKVQAPVYGGHRARVSIVRNEPVDGRVTFSAKFEAPKSTIIYFK